jgi:hypothetical protein
MTIKTNSHDITVSSVISTTVRKDGKSYPALKFVFDGAVSAEDIAALASGSFTIGEDVQQGYTTLGEISVIVSKITTAEQKAAELETELTEVTEKHDEYVETVGTILPVLDDTTAVKVKTLFPKWEIGVAYVVGDRMIYNDRLYKVQQAHTSQADWTPDIVPSLYVVIDETHEGTMEDPIPAATGMLYEKDKYYIHNDVIYLCIREDTDEGTILQFTPDQLVGQYFEAAE